MRLAVPAPRPLVVAIVALHDVAFAAAALASSDGVARVFGAAAVPSALVLLAAARRHERERSRRLACIAALARALAAIAWLVLVARGAARAEAGYGIVVASGLVPAFLLLLAGARPATVVAVAAIVHAAASIALVAVSGGTEAEPSLDARRAFVLAHVPEWTAAWTLWAASSLSFGALVVAWSRRMRAPRAGVAVALIGLPIDLAGEFACAVAMARPTGGAAAFASAAATFRWCGPVVANGLYSAGGLALSLAAWRAGLLRGAPARLGFAVWGVGFALSAAALAGSGRAQVVLGAALMALFIPWAALLARRLARA